MKSSLISCIIAQTVNIVYIGVGVCLIGSIYTTCKSEISFRCSPTCTMSQLRYSSEVIRHLCPPATKICRQLRKVLFRHKLLLPSAKPIGTFTTSSLHATIDSSLNVNASVFIPRKQYMPAKMDFSLNVNASVFVPRKQFLLSNVDLPLNINAPVFLPKALYLQSTTDLTLNINASNYRIVHSKLDIPLNINASVFTPKEQLTVKQLECNLRHKSAVINCF